MLKLCCLFLSLILLSKNEIFYFIIFILEKKHRLNRSSLGKLCFAKEKWQNESI